MKPYGVASIRTGQLMNFAYAPRDVVRAAQEEFPKLMGVAWHERPLHEPWDEDHMSSLIRVHWTNTKEDAELMAKTLAYLHPQFQWIVFQSSKMFSASVNVPVASVFTEKGIVPA